MGSVLLVYGQFTYLQRGYRLVCSHVSVVPGAFCHLETAYFCPRKESWVMTVTKSFDLSEEILDVLIKEFPPKEVVDDFASQCAGKDTQERLAVGQRVFGDWGRRWMNRSVDLGEEYSDQTYEMMKKVARETGLFAFPHVPQRFFEIAYMGVQPIPFLKIVVNNQQQLAYRLTKCAIFDRIEEKCGQEIAAELHCKHACLAGAETLFDRLGMKANVRQVTTIPADGKCEFSTVQG